MLPFEQGDSSFIALQVEVPYRDLCFLKDPAGGMVSRFALMALVLRGDRQVLGELWEQEVRVASRRALYEGGRLQRHYLLPVGPGTYQVEVVLRQAHAGLEGRLHLGVDLNPIGVREARFVALFLGDCGRAGTLTDLLADPALRTEFQEPPAHACAYTDLHHPGLAAGEIRLRWRIQRALGGPCLAEGEERFGAAPERTRLSWEVPLGDLWLDEYRLEVVATVAGRRAEGGTGFSILNETEEALAPFFRENLEALRYIADEDEVAELRMAAPEERKARWDAFWARRDPNPERPRNGFKEEFFRRLRYVNRHFCSGRPGWRTDRGRIYIRYGEPDAIDRAPVQPSGRPTEVWHYDRYGLRLVFVDRSGFGDYELVSAPE